MERKNTQAPFDSQQGNTGTAQEGRVDVQKRRQKTGTLEKKKGLWRVGMRPRGEKNLGIAGSGTLFLLQSTGRCCVLPPLLNYRRRKEGKGGCFSGHGKRKDEGNYWGA